MRAPDADASSFATPGAAAPAPPLRRCVSGRAASFFVRVYATVRAIRRGRVLTYGQVARLLGTPRGARAVGWALRALDPRREPRVPWHRVVGAGGRVSPRSGSSSREQVLRLRSEGVRFRAGRIDMACYGAL